MPLPAAVAVAMVIVQAADAVVGNLIGDRFKTIGPRRDRSRQPGGPDLAIGWCLKHRVCRSAGRSFVRLGLCTS